MLGDWFLRAGVAIAFAFVGWDKFPNGTMWVGLFQQIGLGQWFRYFTGVVEIVGGLLVLIPATAKVGFGVLAATMAAAALIHLFVLGHPGNGIIPAIVAIGLTVGCWTRRNSSL